MYVIQREGLADHSNRLKRRKVLKEDLQSVIKEVLFHVFSTVKIESKSMYLGNYRILVHWTVNFHCIATCVAHSSQ